MVALIYISLIDEDVEHLFTCLLFIQVVFAKCCSNFCLFFFFPFAQLSVRFFIFLLLQKLFSYSGYKFFTGYIFFQPVSSLFSCLRLPLKDKNCSFD